jgi:hypothetical protein
MPTTAVIPERTIDAWTAAEILQFDPFARVWAPTPRSQANSELWDYAVSAGRKDEKLFVLENKGLYQQGKAGVAFVGLDLVQLARLTSLSNTHHLPAYYGLPGVNEGELAPATSGVLGRAEARLTPRRFGDWHLVGPAADLLAHPPVWSAVRRGQRSKRLRVSDFPAFEGMRRFLGRTVTCEHGWNLSDSPFRPPPRSALTSQASERAWVRIQALARRTRSAEDFRGHLLEIDDLGMPDRVDDHIDRRFGQLVWAAVA